MSANTTGARTENFRKRPCVRPSIEEYEPHEPSHPASPSRRRSGISNRMLTTRGMTWQPISSNNGREAKTNDPTHPKARNSNVRAAPHTIVERSSPDSSRRRKPSAIAGATPAPSTRGQRCEQTRLGSASSLIDIPTVLTWRGPCARRRGRRSPNPVRRRWWIPCGRPPWRTRPGRDGRPG